MSKLFKFRIINTVGIVSLTNISLMIAMFRVLIAKDLNFVHFAIFVAALVAYNFKRWHDTKIVIEQDTLAQRLDNMEKSISNCQSVLALKRQL